jgi:hypothetical protein
MYHATTSGEEQVRVQATVISGTLLSELENILASVICSGKIRNTLYLSGPFSSHRDYYISRASWVGQLVECVSRSHANCYLVDRDGTSSSAV